MEIILDLIQVFLNLACMNKEELLGKNSYKISEEEALIDKIFESDKGVVENKKVVTFELNISMNDETSVLRLQKGRFLIAMEVLLE